MLEDWSPSAPCAVRNTFYQRMGREFSCFELPLQAACFSQSVRGRGNDRFLISEPRVRECSHPPNLSCLCCFPWCVQLPLGAGSKVAGEVVAAFSNLRRFWLAWLSLSAQVFLYVLRLEAPILSVCSSGAEAVAVPWVPLNFLLQKQKAFCNQQTFLWECCLQISSALMHRALLFRLMPLTKALSSVLGKAKLSWNRMPPWLPGWGERGWAASKLHMALETAWMWCWTCLG